MKKRVIIIGAGFSGLSAAAYLAKDGYDVTVVEKNDQPGGRAYTVHDGKYTFELGPSWYLMPDVFEEWFKSFNHVPTDFYALKPLSPSYRIFDNAGRFDMYSGAKALEVADAMEPGASHTLATLLKKTSKEYTEVRSGLLELDGINPIQALRPDVLRFLINPELARSYHKRIASYIKNPRLQHALEFMTVFMGGSPHNIPAYYSLLAHVDMGLGGWYPMGGFSAVAKAMETVAKEKGATIRYKSPVERIQVKNGHAVGVIVDGELLTADLVISSADYEFTEQHLVEAPHRSYTQHYWDTRQLSPSALLVTVGVSKKIPQLKHHNLFFDTNWEGHFDEVFNKKTWSTEPLFYLCAPSKSDPNVAPKGHENLFFLAPMAATVTPSKSEMQDTVQRLIARLEKAIGQKITDNITTLKIYSGEYFKDTFNAFGGNAFGLSHTLMQSAVLRPKMKSKKIDNLYYIGQYTNPGTGVPMVILSGKIVANIIRKDQQ